MKYSKYINTALLLVLVTIIGCGKNESKTYNYNALEKVTYTVNTKSLKHHPNVESMFLYFDLIIENKSNEEIYLDVGEIQAKLNGKISTETHYDSLASNMPVKEKLKEGQTKLKLYFVYPESLMDVELKEFKVTRYGLSKK